MARSATDSQHGGELGQYRESSRKICSTVRIVKRKTSAQADQIETSRLLLVFTRSLMALINGRWAFSLPLGDRLPRDARITSNVWKDTFISRFTSRSCDFGDVLSFFFSFSGKRIWSHTVRAVTQRMADLGLSFDLIDFEAEVDKGFSHKFMDWCFFSL